MLVSLWLNAVAACSTLKGTHSDKWSASVPVMGREWRRGGEGITWVTSNPAVINKFLGSFPPITSNQNAIFVRPRRGRAEFNLLCFSHVSAHSQTSPQVPFTTVNAVNYCIHTHTTAFFSSNSFFQIHSKVVPSTRPNMTSSIKINSPLVSFFTSLVPQMAKRSKIKLQKIRQFRLQQTHQWL